MRVIAGDYRGRSLKSLKGENTRPTTDRVKEALMSSLVSAQGSFEGSVVLDAFAGTGALGIEALSRGANCAVFCEQNKEALRVVQANLSLLAINQNRFVIHKGNVFDASTYLSSYSFDIAFLDPPYRISSQEVFAFINECFDSGAFGCDTLICYEHGKTSKSKVQDELSALQWEIVSEKDYGDTSLVIFRRGN